MTTRFAVRWALLVACWFAVLVVALLVRTGNGPLWFLAGLAVAWLVPRVWRWSSAGDRLEGVGE